MCQHKGKVLIMQNNDSSYRIISSVVFMCHLKIVLVFITLGRFYLSEPILIISNQGDR